MWLLVLVTLCTFTLIFKFFLSEDEKPIFGIYQRRSKWFPVKYGLYIFIFYVVKYLRKLFASGNSTEMLTALDRPLPLVDDVKAFDGVLFAGGNDQGYYFVMAAERCQKRVVNGYFYLLVPRKGLLCSTKLPDTVLFDGGSDYFGAEGMIITPIKSMEKWKLRYRGFMWLYPNRIRFRVRFSAQWSTSYKSFNCFEHFYPPTLAKSVATEAWTTEFFENMKSSVNVQYFQMGSVKVECVVGAEIHDFHTLSFRSHAHGTKKDLTCLHRSANFYIFLDDGVTAVVGVVSRRSGISSLEGGYVQKPDGSIHPVQWCDFQLYQHGECGRPPLDHGFQFKADVTYTIQMKVFYEHIHFVGWNWEVKVVERFVKCAVNGVFGQGVSDFQYRNQSGRPARINDEDPSWFQVFRPHYIYS